MSSRVPPAVTRKPNRKGQLPKLSREHKVKRLERRARKKSWAARVWVRQHVQGRR